MRTLISAVVGTALVACLLTVVGATAQAAPAADPVASTFVPASPVRVLDTRTGPALGPGGTVTVNLSSRLPADATAVVLNVTGIALTAPTYVTAYPAGSPRPGASNLNLVAGETRPNLVTVAVGQNRSVVLYNDKGNAHLLADLAGYYRQGAGDRFTPRQAQRIFSTTIGANGTAVVDLSKVVPASATAVTVNLTGVGPTASHTYVTAWPAGTPRPTTSNLNLVAGGILPNQATVRLGAGRKISLYNAVGSVQVIVDLSGFYTPEYGAVFTPVQPARVFDTRNGTGTENAQVGPVPPRTTSWFYPGEPVPDIAIAAVVNLTGVASTATYVGVQPSLATGDHETSVLNLAAGRTAANLAVVPLTADTTSSRNGFYNHNGNTHLIADLAGYFWVPQAACVADCALVWGGDLGTLGIGRTTYYSLTPTPLFGVPGLRAAHNEVAVRTDGTVWTWGDNRYGKLGSGWSGGSSTVPVQVSGLANIVAVADAEYGKLALRNDGTVWTWGSAILGRTVPSESAIPLQVPGLTGVTAIAAGVGTAYVLRQDGTVWSWGMNGRGQVGIGSTASYVYDPTRVVGLTAVTAIAGSDGNGYAVRTDGTVWSWGGDANGQLGNGATGTDSRAPVQVSGLTNMTGVGASYGNGYAVRSDGTVWAWGDGSFGQLGDGRDCGFDPCQSDVAVRVSDLGGAVSVIGLVNGGMALDSTGRVWAWGSNSSGEFGNGTNVGALTPVQVPGLPAIEALYSRDWGGIVVHA